MSPTFLRSSPVGTPRVAYSPLDKAVQPARIPLIEIWEILFHISFEEVRVQCLLRLFLHDFRILPSDLCEFT